MAGKKRGEVVWQGLDVAVNELKPADVSVRDLAELLEATAATMEAIADEEGVERPLLRLVKIQEASAHYVMTAGTSSTVLVKKFYDHVKTRGKHANSQVRRGIGRLNGSVRGGSICVTPLDAKNGKLAKSVSVALPAEARADATEHGTELYGRVAGVMSGRDGMTVRIKIDGGGTEDFGADADVAHDAARLFEAKIKANVTFARVDGGTRALKIEHVEAWADDDFMTAISSISRKLADSGLSIDVDAFLSESD